MEGDALLVAAGRLPNVEDLGLYAAGVSFSPKGITTNDRMKTNVPHIYACGDVNGTLPFTHVAGYEAGIALTNAVLHLPMKADYRKCGWRTYTDPEVASIGLNEKRAQREGTEYRVVEETFRVNDRALAEGETQGYIKILVTPKGRFLGAQIVGPHAGELIHEWVLSSSAGVKLSTIAGMVHLYPTLSEISKKVAGDLLATRIFSERTRTLLRLLFNLKGRACE
jgi:pyruvate/2-oxoglutarate dehydrogenase complex dihydrolipoamide dehydrogenase (E3) component